MDFANKTSVFAPNTLKLTMKVEGWPFKSLQNSLAIVLDAASNEYNTQACNINSQTDSGGSLAWYVLNFCGVSMYLLKII